MNADIKRLVDIYKESEKRLIHRIELRIKLSRSTLYERKLLKEIRDEIRRLNKLCAAWSKETISKVYMGAVSKALSESSKVLTGSFGGLHKPAIAILAKNSQRTLLAGNNLIGRRVIDLVRKVSLEATTRKYTEGLTLKEMRTELLNELSEKGLMRVPMGLRSMRADSYAELVARTTTTDTVNTALLNQAKDMDEVLVKMTGHSPTCKLCAARQGRVYRTVELDALPVGDPRREFPHISMAFPRYPEFKTVHPNCRHAIVIFAWDEKSDEEKEQALKKAKQPFDFDPRSEVELIRYDKNQKEKRERLRDRYQWERYKKVLGEESVPKTLSAFRKMKQSGNENWQELSSDYRYALRLARKDDIMFSEQQRSLPVRGEAFGIKDLVLEDGRVRQRRLYGEDGKVLKDIDTDDHGNRSNHPFGAHAHDWGENGHSKGRQLTDSEKRRNKDILK